MGELITDSNYRGKEPVKQLLGGAVDHNGIDITISETVVGLRKPNLHYKTQPTLY